MKKRGDKSKVLTVFLTTVAVKKISLPKFSWVLTANYAMTIHQAQHANFSPATSISLTTMKAIMNLREADISI